MDNAFSQVASGVPVSFGLCVLMIAQLLTGVGWLGS